MSKGFRQFVLRGNVVDLAVAVVIGAAFGALVKSFVEDMLTPIIGMLFGQPDFSNLTFIINKSTFHYGSFINAIITFVSVAAAIYFFVVVPLNKLADIRARRVAHGEPDPEPKPEDVQLLEQIRDLLKAQSASD